MLSSFRSFGKRALRNVPGAQAAAKAGWTTAKYALDRQIVRKRHGDVRIVNFEPDDLRRLRADGFQSQYGQDKYLMDLIGAKQDGVFVDIGCNHPILNSNSFAFEARGWSVYAFDALPHLAALWAEHREARFTLAAISADAGEREFVSFASENGWEHQLSGFRDTVRQEDLDLYDYETFPVRTGTVSDFWPELAEIDVLSIDVEGAEHFVLEGLDFARLSPRWILIENAREVGGLEDLRETLTGHGYRFHSRIAANDDLFERA